MDRIRERQRRRNPAPLNMPDDEENAEPVAAPVLIRRGKTRPPERRDTQIGGANAPIIESYNIIESYLPSMQPKATQAQPPDQTTAN